MAVVAGLTAQHISSVIEAIPIPVFVKDRNSRFILMNQACRQDWGIDFAAIENTDGSACIPSEQRLAIQRNDQEVFAGATPVTVAETCWNARLGENRLAQIHKCPIPDAAGQPQFLICAQADVTAPSLPQEEGAVLQSMIDNAPYMIWMKDLAGRYLAVNRAALGHFGVASTGDIVGKTDLDLWPQALARHKRQSDAETLRLGRQMTAIEPEQRDGRQGFYEINKVPAYGPNGLAMGVTGFARDVTEQIKAQEQLRIADIAFEAQVGMFVTDANNIILRINQALLDMSGYGADDVLGHDAFSFRPGANAIYETIWQQLQDTGSWHGELVNRRKNGALYPTWATMTAVKDVDRKITHFVGTLTDITDRKVAEEAIERLAFYDPLTGLPNRRLLIDRLGQALTGVRRGDNDGALLMIDLDHFKTVNDSFSHSIGDMLLQQVAERLIGCVRSGDTVARLGGDEFVVIVEGLDLGADGAAAQTEVIAEKILEELNRPYHLGQHLYQSSASIGATLFHDHILSVDELLRHADIAMYQAKNSGRNGIRFFDPKMQSLVTSRLALEADLRRAISGGELLLHYQLQVDHRGRPLGAEALLRWNHPERGLVPPSEFIPLAEETGLILPLGAWVLETACRQLVAWSLLPETRSLSLAVNVSARQFRQKDFVQGVLGALGRAGAEPQRLKLELTESMLLDNVDDVIDKMAALQASGISFSLDDFGTGYSSLAYLKRLPLSQIKIDQSFVRDVLTDPNDATIARTIIALAHGFGLQVIAEGVETAAQRDFLTQHGCHQYQGYLFSRPLPGEEFCQLMDLLVDT